MKVVFAEGSKFSANLIRENKFDESNADLLLEIRPSDASKFDDLVTVAKENDGQKITITDDNDVISDELNGYVLERATREYQDTDSGLEAICVALFKKRNE